MVRVFSFFEFLNFLFYFLVIQRRWRQEALDDGTSHVEIAWVINVTVFQKVNLSLIYCGVDFGFGGIVIYGRFEVNRERERGGEREREGERGGEREWRDRVGKSEKLQIWDLLVWGREVGDFHLLNCFWPSQWLSIQQSVRLCFCLQSIFLSIKFFFRKYCFI